MKFASRTRPAPDAPGVGGPVRVDRRIRALLPRLRSGDVAVVDQLDLDRATAQRLLDAGVVAVLNASASISGRFPNLGPQVLADAGVVMVDQLGDTLLDAVKDGTAVRVEGDTVRVGEQAFTGRALDREAVTELVEEARTGLSAQLDAFTHNSTEFLRREQDVLLHGRGVPQVATRIADRPVVVVVPGRDFESELKHARRFVAEQKPVVIAVDGAAEKLRAARIRPDVVVVSAHTRDEDLPSARTLKAAKDVVVRVDRGTPRSALERFSKWGLSPLPFETSATTEDAAMILADSAHASVIVGVGMHATLNEFLDRQRAGLASTYLTRLKVGPKLVDATAVGTVYSGRVRPRHLVGVTLAGLVAVVAAVSTTPVGHEWADGLGDSTSSFIDNLQGKLS